VAPGRTCCLSARRRSPARYPRRERRRRRLFHVVLRGRRPEPESASFRRKDRSPGAWSAEAHDDRGPRGSGVAGFPANLSAIRGPDPG
jgi:hypothetical protein